jgi:CRISPR-associated protein Csx17
LAVRWIDTCALVSSETVNYPPLMGTGGNDGNFEFSRTFQQQLQNLFDFGSGEPTPTAADLLRSALFGAVLPGLAFDGKIGQFDPRAAGGPNASTGFGGDSQVNPWDFVLMLEGALVFQTRLTRKFEAATQGALTYPFAVRPTQMGYGSAAKDEAVRAETWLPLWSRPARFDELQMLFGEGRAKLGGRSPRTGVDFAIALSDLGKFRGIEEFVRYGFQERNGLSYFAIPLGRFRPGNRTPFNPLAELEPWLVRFRRFAETDTAPDGVKRVHRLLETRILELAQNDQQPGGAGNPYLAVLIALGEVDQTLNRSHRWTTDQKLRPIPWLNWRWVKRCDDASVEFRLALALACRGLYATVQMVPVERDRHDDRHDDRHNIPQVVAVERDRGFRQRLVQVRGPVRPQWADADGITIWSARSLLDNLLALLQREELEARQADKRRQQDQEQEQEQEQETSDEAALDREAEAEPDPHGAAGRDSPAADRPTGDTVSLHDLDQWIIGAVDESRLEAIARGLALVQGTSRYRPRRSSEAHRREAEFLNSHATYVLLESVTRRVIAAPPNLDTRAASDKPIALPFVPGLLARGGAGDGAAIALAQRRLQIAGFTPPARRDRFQPLDPKDPDADQKRRDRRDWWEQIANPERHHLRRITAALAFPISAEQSQRLRERLYGLDFGPMIKH